MALGLERFVKFARFVDFLNLNRRPGLQLPMVQSFSEGCGIWVRNIGVLTGHSRLCHFPGAAPFDGLLTEVSLKVFHWDFYLLAICAFQTVVVEGVSFCCRILLWHDRVERLLVSYARAIIMRFESSSETGPWFFRDQVLSVTTAIYRRSFRVIVATTSNDIALLKPFLGLDSSLFISRVAF